MEKTKASKSSGQKRTRSTMRNVESHDAAASTSQGKTSVEANTTAATTNSMESSSSSTIAIHSNNTPTASNSDIPQGESASIEPRESSFLDLLNSFTDYAALSDSWVKQGLAARALAKAKRKRGKKSRRHSEDPLPGPSTETLSQNTADEGSDVGNHIAIEHNYDRATEDKPKDKKSTASKRRHESQESPKAKKPKVPSSNDCEMKMAIVPQNFPESVISENMISDIQSLVWDILEKTPNPLPKLFIGTIVTGALHVACEDSAGIEALKKLEGIEVENIKLKLINAKDLPKPVKMAWKTRNVGCTDTTRVLTMLQRLNPSLRTNEWKVIDTIVEQGHTRRIVLVDKLSANVIKDAGYVLPAGIDKCSFKVLENGRRVIAEDN